MSLEQNQLPVTVVMEMVGLESQSYHLNVAIGSLPSLSRITGPAGGAERDRRNLESIQRPMIAATTKTSWKTQQDVEMAAPKPPMPTAIIKATFLLGYP